MVINPQRAAEFIDGYMQFLLYAYRMHNAKGDDLSLLEKLVSGRANYLEDPKSLEKYLHNEKQKPSTKIVEAIKSLQVGHWVYLRDTTKYSLFIESEGKRSLAVLGLTQPIKDICGCSGMYIKTGIVCMDGDFICDGLIANTVKLGRGLREEFNDVYRELKASGAFFRNVCA